MPLPTNTYDQLVLAGSPQIYWPLNETNNVQTDLVGHNTLTLDGPSLEMFAIGLHYGDLVPSLSLRSGTDLFGIPTAPVAINAPFTVELWAQVNGGVEAVAFSTRTPDDFGTQIGFDANGALSCTIGGVGAFAAIIAPTSPTCGTFSRFHMVALSADSSNWHAYIDGTQVATGANAVAPILYNASHNVRVGSYNGASNWLNSSVSRVALYNYVVSPANLLNHFAAGIPGGGSNPGTIITVPASDITDILNAVRKTFPTT